ncbi:hypothetical protein P7K49_033530 [Saguinus oedipus]|uniref:Uncharacterized protein n=1 Tax=Saguinus oedipus TaxID=9490 RepID=A0ABQ9TT84_SAGOE|nr:hypothetical protein P7K49_033530 [Saguinus oedipus]
MTLLRSLSHFSWDSSDFTCFSIHPLSPTVVNAGTLLWPGEGRHPKNCGALTCDVAEPQVTEGQNDPGGLSLSRGHTHLLGQMAFARMPNKLDALGNRELHVHLQRVELAHDAWNPGPLPVPQDPTHIPPLMHKPDLSASPRAMHPQEGPLSTSHQNKLPSTVCCPTWPSHAHQSCCEPCPPLSPPYPHNPDLPQMEAASSSQGRLCCVSIPSGTPDGCNLSHNGSTECFS